MFDRIGVPQPGSLEESVLLRVWNKRKQIERLQGLALLLSGYGEGFRQKAGQLFDSAWDLMLPKTGDVRGLESHEKDAVSFLQKLVQQGTAFKITPDKAHGMTRIRSRLNRLRRASQKKRR